MKVLFLTNIPSPYRVDFFNELGKYCELTVLYERRNAADRESKWIRNKSDKFKEFFLDGKAIGTDSSLSLSVFKYLKDRTYDIIVIGGYSTLTGMLAIEYLKFKRRKFILNIDGGMINSDSSIKFKIKKHFISSPSAWLSTGKESNKYLEHYGAISNNIYEYPFTSIKERDILKKVTLEEDKMSYRKKLGMNEKYIVLSVGQFIYRKGYDVLLEACKTISKDIGVYIVGGKATEEYLIKKEELELDNVHFIDFKTMEEIKEYYKASDIFVLPTREDIWGLVINEAMAYGLPVITTEKCIAGMELIKNNENGYIIPIDDKKELADKITKIIDDEDLRLNMSINNIKTIEEYTIENMALRHMDIFKSIKGGVL